VHQLTLCTGAGPCDQAQQALCHAAAYHVHVMSSHEGMCAWHVCIHNSSPLNPITDLTASSAQQLCIDPRW